MSSLLKRNLVIRWTAGFIVLLALLLIAYARPAGAANPTTINFQGKVVNADGTNVSNGSYTFVFRLYDTSSPTTSGTCASNAGCWWEETDSITVTNGVFQVELGSGCTFTSACNSSHSGIDFNTNNALYLTLKFNGDAAGFMSPTVHLTAAPYAFNADKVGGVSVSSLARNDSGNTFASTNVFNGLSTYNTDADFVFNGTENLSITSDLAGTLNVLSLIGTSSGTAGTTAGLFIQQADSANSNGLDSAISIDNTDTNLAIPAAIKIANSGGGGYTTIIDDAGTLISGTELNYLDGHDAALVDTNDAVALAITGTGALNAGSIASGFGAIDIGADNITTTGVVYSNTFDRSTAGLLSIGTGGASAATSITLGSSSVTAITLTTDGTGDAEVVLPTGSISGTEILNDTVALTTDTSGNYVASITNGTGISGGNGGSEGAGLTLSIDQSAGLTWTGTEAFNSATSFTPNSTNDVVFNVDGDSNVQVTASAAPAVDMVSISNSGQGVTTAGVSGLQITYVGGAAAVEASAQRIDITGGTTAGAGAIWNGLRLVQGTITAGTTVQDIKLETAALTTTSGTTVINGLNLATAGAINNSTAGSIAWNGLAITTANVTQGSGGTATASALDITVGTLTTGGKQTGLTFENITAPTVGQTRGLSFGTGWNDTHSSTAASNNLANILINGTSAGSAAQTFTIKSSNNVSGATTATPLLELRDLSNTNNTRFAGLALSDAFLSRQSYWGEEFNNFRANSTVTMATTASGTAGVRGDTTALSIDGVAGVSATGSTATYSANAANGYEEITCVSGNAARSSNCLLTNSNGTAGQQWGIINTGNMPQVAMKFRAGNGVAPSSTNFYYAGISNLAVAVTSGPTNSYAANATKGAYFSNCSSPNGTVSGCGNTWFGIVADNSTTPAAPSTNETACPANDQQGSAPQNANFMYGRIEFRRDTSGSSVEIQYFIDYDVTNGIVETSCGTVTSTGATMGNTAMGVFLDAMSAGNATAKLDIDYIRVYQDDAPNTGSLIANTIPTPVDDTPTNTAPLTLDASPDNTNNDFFSFLAATSEDTVFNHDVYVHGTLFVDKIKANKIEGLEIATNKVSPITTPSKQTTTTSSSSVSTTTDMNIIGRVIANGGLTVSGPASFSDTAAFQKLVSFLDKVTFNSDVSFLGRPTFNADTGGFAIIKAGQDSIEVKYTTIYKEPPVINLTIRNGQFASYAYTYIKDKQQNIIGFKINLQQSADNDIEFAWSTFSIKDAKTVTSIVP